MLFEYILIKIKNKYENEDGLDTFLNRPNFTRNEIIISALLRKASFFKLLNKVYLLAHKYEHKGVNESINFYNMNFSSVGLAE